ncbi:MAG: UvrD-helicase domain-containing protein, partial [Rubrivivax sp.]
MIAAAPPDADLDALVHGPLDGVRMIEASAGTGKTWALCGLVVRLLLETPLTLPQILVVTFTKAAAAELRARIRDRIASAAALIAGTGASGSDAFVESLLQRLQAEGAAPDALASRLTRALQAFDEASIFTIHGFCQRALAELPLSVGLAPAPTLLEDDTPLRRQVAQDFWRLRIAAMAGGDPSTLAFGALLLRRQDSPDSWAERLRERLRQPLAELRWPVDLPADPGALMAGAPVGRWSALADAHHAVTGLWRAERTRLIARATDALPRLPRNVYSPERLAEAIDGADQLLDLPWTALAAGAVPGGLARLGSARLVVRKGEVPLSPHPFDAALQALLELAGAAADDLARARLALLREFLVGAPAALQRLKQAERVAGFDDLLLDLHRGLSGPDAAGRTGLAAALRSRFPAALIDEFQDTDPLQYTIFQQLYGDGRSPVALVGDPKQAIYSFRSADLPTYLLARAQATARSTLRDNQRSTRALLNGLNGLFTRHARPFMEDGLDYTPVRFGSKPRARLGGANGDPIAPALQLWTLPGSADGGGWLHVAPARRAVAQACAGEIARCLDDGRQGRLTLDGRPFAGGDVAVLVRTHAQGREMRRELAALGVASVELSQASVFASLDAEAAELVLAAVLEPNRLGAVRAALATDWYGWTAAQIEALADAPDAWSGPLLRFAEHHARWRRRGVAPMLRRLVRDDGVMARLLARP